MSPIHIKPKYLLNRPEKQNWRTENTNQYAVFIGKSEFIPGAILIFTNIGKYRELYEIRMKVSGNMVRVLFVKQNEDSMLLYAFYKRSGKDTERVLETAYKMLNKMRSNGEVIGIKAA
jgi:hypothetical protein